MAVSAIIPAAGAGSRYSRSKNKLLEEICGIPVIAKTLMSVSSVEQINEIIVCTSRELKAEIEKIVEQYQVPKIKKIIPGGKTRQESVYNGLQELESYELLNFVVIHDGARPLVSAEIIKETIKKVREKGAVIAAVPAKDTIKKIDPVSCEVIETIDRQGLWNVQTPQVFKYNDILGVHEGFKGENLTDDSALMEKAGYKVWVCMGSYENIKITTQEDIAIAQSIVEKQTTE